MHAVVVRQVVGFALAAWAVALAAGLGAQVQPRGQVRRYKPTISASDPAIAGVVPAGDAVSRLVLRLARGEVALERGADGQGYLASVLTALDVPVDSQLLAFSKTSVQAARTSPQRPRAVYFRDDVMVAHVPGTPGVEAIAIDPARGPVFYALTLDAVGAPSFTATLTCVKCHHGPNTAGVPGVFIGSVIPGPSGAPLRDDTAIITDHTSPFVDRWGGWYVTARGGEPRNRANAVASNPAVPASLVRESGQNLTTLIGLVDPGQYLAPTSDIVALMTFEHQTQMTNLITRVAWQARVAHAAQPFSPLTHPGLVQDVADLVDYLTFVDEARLPGPVTGVSTFTATFPSRGPKDAAGRSLRDFDLRTRLFRYPVSYLIDSPSFEALPNVVRHEILRQVYDRLTGASADAQRLVAPASARRAALTIIRDTVRDLPPYWRRPG